MLYVLALLAVVGLVVISRLVATSVRGGRVIRAVIRGESRPGSPESLFVQWLQENPNRTSQKGLFLFVMRQAGLSEGWCADALIRCIVHAWTPEGKPFGQLLAAEMDRLITWEDPGTDRAKIEAQQKGKAAFFQMKSRLMELDGT